MRDRLDYILVSPELADRITAGGINAPACVEQPEEQDPPRKWTVFPPITSAVHAASDHAAAWIEFISELHPQQRVNWSSDEGLNQR